MEPMWWRVEIRSDTEMTLYKNAAQGVGGN